MALTATLRIGDVDSGNYTNSYLVTSCRFSVSRDNDGFVPNKIPTNKLLEITLVAPDKKDRLIYDWYITRSELSGILEFDMSAMIIHDDSPQIRTVKFINAQCYSLSEIYNIGSINRRMIRIKLSPESSVFDTVTFNNH